MGPVQVLVVAFDRPRFSGEVLAELDRLQEAHVVRLVGVLVVRRAEDGSLETVGAPDSGPPGSGAVAAALLADGTGGTAQPVDTPGETWSLDAIPPGSTAVVALLEHLWAASLLAAIDHAGGRPVEETWLGPDDRRVLEGLLERPATAATGAAGLGAATDR